MSSQSAAKAESAAESEAICRFRDARESQDGLDLPDAFQIGNSSRSAGSVTAPWRAVVPQFGRRLLQALAEIRGSPAFPWRSADLPIGIEVRNLVAGRAGSRRS